MLTEVAPTELQESVVFWPSVMGFGEAVRLMVGTWITVMVTEAVAVPPRPVAVMV